MAVGGLTLGSSRGPSSAARASTDASGGQWDRRESWCSVPVCPSMFASIVVQTVVSRASRGPIRIQILSIEAGFSGSARHINPPSGVGRLTSARTGRGCTGGGCRGCPRVEEVGLDRGPLRGLRHLPARVSGGAPSDG
jgi:hypothetical protein